MESHTSGMQVFRRRHTWQIECQLIVVFPSRVLYAVFQLSFADTGAGAFLSAFLDNGFSIFAGIVRGSGDGSGLSFGRTWSLRGRVFALVDVCW